jgi:predicted ferric reductase
MSEYPAKDMETTSVRGGTGSLAAFLLAIAAGFCAAVLALPHWVPQLTRTLLGTDPKAYWYLSRGAAFVALGLLWISMALGLLITDRLARSWPGTPAAFAFHEYASLLGLAFAVFHALILLGDRYINYRLAQILLPFASVNYHPIWVGLGQIGLYVWAVVSGTFYVRQWIGQGTWRFIHFASFFMFVVALIHGLASGTDSSAPWAQWLYWLLGGSLLLLTFYRILAGLLPPVPATVARPSPQEEPAARHAGA